MTKTTVTSLALAAALIGAGAMIPTAHAQVINEMVTNGPQVNRGDFSGQWSAARNNAESARYDRLLQTSPGFRHARMRKECGPISDPQLHAQCMASFQQMEPMYGSSVPPTGYIAPGAGR